MAERTGNLPQHRSPRYQGNRGVSARAAFKQADLTRAVKALAKAGLSVAGAKIAPDGSITVLTGIEPANDAGNPLDRILPQ